MNTANETLMSFWGKSLDYWCERCKELNTTKPSRWQTAEQIDAAYWRAAASRNRAAAEYNRYIDLVVAGLNFRPVTLTYFWLGADSVANERL